MAWLEEMGLEASIDGIGNVSYGGHKAGSASALGQRYRKPERGRAAGWAVGRWRRWRWPGRAPVNVVASPMGRPFRGRLLGSKSIIGALPEEGCRSRSRNDGHAAARRAGRAPGWPGAADGTGPGRHRPSSEMHIEQGTQLENAGIVGRRRHRNRSDLAVAQSPIEGMQDHAGGAPWPTGRCRPRRVRLLADDDEGIRQGLASGTTWTTGRIAAGPGHASMIRQGRYPVRVREIDLAALERLERCLRRPAWRKQPREGWTATLNDISKSLPAPCDPANMAA